MMNNRQRQHQHGRPGPACHITDLTSAPKNRHCKVSPRPSLVRADREVRAAAVLRNRLVDGAARHVEHVPLLQDHVH